MIQERLDCDRIESISKFLSCKTTEIIFHSMSIVDLLEICKHAVSSVRATTARSTAADYGWEELSKWPYLRLKAPTGNNTSYYFSQINGSNRPHGLANYRAPSHHVGFNTIQLLLNDTSKA